jgi:hypothetical protein
MEHADPVATLERWHASGAVWRVLARRPDAVTVGLYTCDGGEEVERLTSGDARLVRFVAGRDGSEE